MATLFDSVALALEEATRLDRLATRGTVRLALKQAGLDAADVDPDQMAVVLRTLLPPELDARGVAEGAAICETIAARVGELDGAESPTGDRPEDVFRRLDSL